VAKYPSIIYVEPTNDCNMRCVMCPRERTERVTGFMDFDLYRSIVDSIVDVGEPVTLVLHLLGESLLHPQIIDMVSYAKRQGVEAVNLSTNGTLLNDDVSAALVEARLDVLGISMDSSSAQAYSPSTAAEAAGLDDKIRKLLAIRSAAAHGRPRVNLRIIEMPSTAGLIDDFRARWEPLVDWVTVQPMLSWAGHVNLPQGHRFWPLEKRTVCIKPIEHMAVRWDGRVTMCCLYPGGGDDGTGTMGDLTSETLAEVANGPRRQGVVMAQFMRDWTQIPGCEACPDWRDLSQIRAALRREKAEES
jgi:hypothetical protein